MLKRTRKVIGFDELSKYQLKWGQIPLMSLALSLLSWYYCCSLKLTATLWTASASKQTINRAQWIYWRPSNRSALTICRQIWLFWCLALKLELALTTCLEATTTTERQLILTICRPYPRFISRLWVMLVHCSSFSRLRKSEWIFISNRLPLQRRTSLSRFHLLRLASTSTSSSSGRVVALACGANNNNSSSNR